MRPRRHRDVLDWLEDENEASTVVRDVGSQTAAPETATAVAASGQPVTASMVALFVQECDDRRLIASDEAAELLDAVLLSAQEHGELITVASLRDAAAAREKEPKSMAIAAAATVDPDQQQRQVYLHNRVVVRNDLVKELSESNANLREQLRQTIEMMMSMTPRASVDRGPVQRRLGKKQPLVCKKEHTAEQIESRRQEIEAAVRQALSQ